MEMTGLEIFKYLPGAKKEAHTNCKECGCPTCMAFALRLAKQKIELEKCPYRSTELNSKYNHSIKHAQKTINICGLITGGENVLYRHEKTFINRTIFGIIVDCNLPDYENKIKTINDFVIKGVNENLKIDLVILKNYTDKKITSEIPTISYEEFRNFELYIIEDDDFNQTKNKIIEIREKAITQKDDNFSNPICVWLKETNPYKICANASYYICKGTNILLFEEFNREMFSTILRLRENIYTDPQKPLQVESGLYEFNSPDKNSIIFLTTNFALTFFAVSNELESLDIPSYLIVIPADGMSVLTAWSAEKFTANIVAKTIEQLNVKEKVSTRKIIIPGLLAHMKEELKETLQDFEFIVGTREASDIKEFIKNLYT